MIDSPSVEELVLRCLEFEDSGEIDEIPKLLSSHPHQADEVRQCLAELGALERALTPDAPAPPNLEDFEALRLLGSGAMGDVYLAEQRSLRRPVALKIIRVASERGRERFHREAQALARLDHEHVVRVHASGEENGCCYIAMQLVLGRSLEEILADEDSRRALEVSTILRWGRDIARALHAVHAMQLVHRDVKPANLRITPEGEAVLVDFGLARLLDAHTLSMDGAFVGTPHYAAPEQVRGETAAISPATDVHALGATLYEAISGVRPFDGRTTEQVLHQILDEPVRPLRRVAPGATYDLELVLGKSLEKRPQDRYPSAAAFAEDLDAVLTHRSVSVRAPSAPSRAFRWIRRHPLPAALLLCLGLVFGAGGFIASRWDTHRRGEEVERTQEIERLLTRGLAIYGEVDHEGAEQAFRQVLALDPKHAEAVAGIALARLAAGDSDRLLAFLDEHRDLISAHPGLQHLRHQALVLRDGAESDEAKKTALPPLRNEFDHFVAGRIQLWRGNRAACKQAVQHFEAAILRAAKPRLIHHATLVVAARAAGDLEREQKHLHLLRDLWPEEPATLYWTAMAAVRSDFDEALNHFDRFIARKPRDLSVLVGVGGLSYDRRRYRESFHWFERACAIAPDHLKAQAGRAAALEMTDRFAEAADAWAIAAQLAPDNPDYAGHHAFSLAIANRAEEAFEVAVGARKRFPNHPMPRVAEARALLAAGRWTDATQAARSSAKAFGDGAAWNQLISTCRRAERLGPSVLACAKGASLPESPEDRLALARMAWSLGRMETAVTWFETLEGTPLFSGGIGKGQPRFDAARFALALVHRKQKRADHHLSCAIRWLSAELDAIEEVRKSGSSPKKKLRAALQAWSKLSPLELIRHERQRQALPPEQRSRAKALWQRAQKLRAHFE